MAEATEAVIVESPAAETAYVAEAPVTTAVVIEIPAEPVSEQSSETEAAPVTEKADEGTTEAAVQEETAEEFPEEFPETTAGVEEENTESTSEAEESVAETSEAEAEEPAEESSAIATEEYTEESSEKYTEEGTGLETEEETEEETTEEITEEEQELQDSAVVAEKKKYTYKVTPLAPPFNQYLYLQTDDPDVSNIRLVDYDIQSSKETAVFMLVKRIFADVVYENEATFRVKGGYLFYSKENFASDGGTLSVEVTEGTPHYYSVYEDTSIRIQCPAMMSYVRYLIDNYTSPGKSLFENLDAIQSALNQLAVYPLGILDSQKPSSTHPYPFYSTSVYKELDLNSRYDMYEYHDGGILLAEAYPYVLDSSGFPSTIYRAVLILDPEAGITWNTSYHWLIDVTKDGITRSYGGDGEGEPISVTTNSIDKTYTFTGGGGDFASAVSLQTMREKYRLYQNRAEEELATAKEWLTGETYNQAIGNGAWVRICAEQGGFTYSYITGTYGFPMVVSNTWVEGWYISDYEAINLGLSFDDHPTANILLRGQSYVDDYGELHSGVDILYYYVEENNRWQTVPSRSSQMLTLSKEQARALVNTGNNHRIPDNYLIYDGTAFPGTPVTTVHAAYIQASIGTKEGMVCREEKVFTAKVMPENAVDTRIKITSSDESIIKITEDWDTDPDNILYKLTAVKSGSATITMKSIEGDAVFKSVVTVAPSSKGWNKNTNGWWYDNGDGTWPMGAWKLISGSWYYFDYKGYVADGYVTYEDGKYYTWEGYGANYLSRFDGKGNTDGVGYASNAPLTVGDGLYYFANGSMVTGWKMLDGFWYYFKPNGIMARNCWVNDRNNWYYIDYRGYYETGWHTEGNDRYYLNDSGVMVTGWKYIDGRWYYFRKNGVMAVGWLQDQGRWYFMDTNGRMLIGWYYIGNRIYHFSNSGAMSTGWLKENGNWYRFTSSGAMCVSRWYDNYYFDDYGIMATDTWIGAYYVGKDGKWVPGKKK